MIVSPDSFLYEKGEYRWSPSRVKTAWVDAGSLFRQALSWSIKPDSVVLMVGAPASGKSTWLAENADERVLYFDATFDLPWKRKKWLDIAAAANVPAVIVWLDTPLEVCIERNARRPDERRVPDEVVRAMHSKIMSSPPSGSENAVITRVRFGG